MGLLAKYNGRSRCIAGPEYYLNPPRICDTVNNGGQNHVFRVRPTLKILNIVLIIDIQLHSIKYSPCNVNGELKWLP